MQNVYQPFVSYLSPNESTFQIDNPEWFRDGIQRAYSFAYLNIIPDYFSKLASENEIENEAVNPTVVKYPMTFDWSVYSGFYTANFKDKIEHTIPTTKLDINSLVKNINDFMSSHTPIGMKHPPVVIDWVNEDNANLKTNSAIFDYFTKYGPTLYAEDDVFSMSTHYNFLPANAKTISMMTNFKIPTDEDELAKVRLRIHVAPNTIFKVSSEALVTILGFTNVTRGPLKQFEFINKHPTKSKIFYGDEAPQLKFKLTGANTVYVDRALLQNMLAAFIETTRLKELQVKNIVNGIQSKLSLFTDSTYLEVDCQYNEVENKVIFNFPQNAKLDIKILLPAELNKKLGFDLHNPISKLNYESTTLSFDKLETQKMFYFSQIISKDTGQVVITIENLPSLSSRIESNQIMAALTPKDGCLAMEPLVRPYVLLGQKDKHLTFKINRFSEKGTVIPLSWNIGCYINGALEGKPV